MSWAMTPLHSVAVTLATAVFAAAGLVGFCHASTGSAAGAGAFGAPLAHVQVQPLYRERGTTAGLRQVPCAGTSGTARCFEAGTAR